MKQKTTKKHHTVGTVSKSSQFIDLTITERPTSLISVICRTRTSSIVFKTYIETREGMGQPGQQLLTAIEYVCRFRQ